jgi:hypothetical protein
VFGADGRGRFVPVERDRREASMASIDRGRFNPGRKFIPDLPGGHVQPHREICRSRKAVIMAIKAQAPILPVAVSGGRSAMQKGMVRAPVMVDVRSMNWSRRRASARRSR